jgi:hypothetical protein
MEFIVHDFQLILNILSITPLGKSVMKTVSFKVLREQGILFLFQING